MRVLIAADRSGSGKTFVSMALATALRQRGRNVMVYKLGPDFIDAGYHTRLALSTLYTHLRHDRCLRDAHAREFDFGGVHAGRNLDSWAMRPETISTILHKDLQPSNKTLDPTSRVHGESDVVVEGAMGLFDGGSGGKGSTASLALFLRWPVVMVISARGLGQSVGAVVHGFEERAVSLGIKILGWLVNDVASERHASLLQEGLNNLSSYPRVLGFLPRQQHKMDSRWLGLKQSWDYADDDWATLLGQLESFAKSIDTESLLALYTAHAIHEAHNEAHETHKTSPYQREHQLKDSQRSSEGSSNSENSSNSEDLRDLEGSRRWSEHKLHETREARKARSLRGGSSQTSQPHRQTDHPEASRTIFATEKTEKTEKTEEILPWESVTQGISRQEIQGIPPLGQRIAVAFDEAFSFTYTHTLEQWRQQGAEIVAFSPLAHDNLPLGIDAVYLPGGYVELHAARFSKHPTLKKALEDLAQQGGIIYGECGGWMALGEGIILRDGSRFPMLGLLPLGFIMGSRPKRLGYCTVILEGGRHRASSLLAPSQAINPLTQGLSTQKSQTLQASQTSTNTSELWRLGQDTGFVRQATLRGHAFHYARLDETSRPALPALFSSVEMLTSPASSQNPSDDTELRGVRLGNVMGSFVHLIDVFSISTDNTYSKRMFLSYDVVRICANV